MQVSQQFIAIQKVSLEGYQRLRETLMQQAYLFESVITEAPPKESPSKESTRERTKTTAQSTVEQVKTCFVLMRSPALNVLLVAIPLSELTENASSATQPNLQTPNLQTNNNSTQPYQLISSLSDSKPNLMQAILSQALLPIVTSQNEQLAYHIQLSFDDQTINSFIQEHSLHEQPQPVSSPIDQPLPNRNKPQNKTATNHPAAPDKVAKLDDHPISEHHTD